MSAPHIPVAVTFDKLDDDQSLDNYERFEAMTNKAKAIETRAAAMLEALQAFEQGPPDGDNTDRWFAQYAVNLHHARAAITLGKYQS